MVLFFIFLLTFYVYFDRIFTHSQKAIDSHLLWSHSKKRRQFILTYKMYQVTTTHLGTMCIKYQVDNAQREITISSQIFKRLGIMIPQREKGLLCLVIFRNKFRKKMVNDSFDKKVIHFLSQKDLTTGFIETLSNLSRNELNEYLDT